MTTFPEMTTGKQRELNPLLAELPDRIKWARELWRWTQFDLANASGIEQASISRYERGERLVSISADTVIRLAAAMRLELRWLATGQGRVFVEGGPVLTMREGDTGPSFALPGKDTKARQLPLDPPAAALKRDR